MIIWHANCAILISVWFRCQASTRPRRQPVHKAHIPSVNLAQCKRQVDRITVFVSAPHASTCCTCACVWTPTSSYLFLMAYDSRRSQPTHDDATAIGFASAAGRARTNRASHTPTTDADVDVGRGRSAGFDGCMHARRALTTRWSIYEDDVSDGGPLLIGIWFGSVVVVDGYVADWLGRLTNC